MADYAGAVAAIKARMAANWTTTPVVYQNAGNAYDPSSNPQAAWVYFEVLGSSGGLRGVGTPGSHVYLYRGFIAAHVFVPVNAGDELAQQHAVTIGEIFRHKEFYTDTPPNCVRTLTPQTDGGGSDADDGNWWRVTMSCPFEFYYRG